jgi:hypothetical protein
VALLLRYCEDIINVCARTKNAPCAAPLKNSQLTFKKAVVLCKKQAGYAAAVAASAA